VILFLGTVRAERAGVGSLSRCTVSVVDGLELCATEPGEMTCRIRLYMNSTVGCQICTFIPHSLNPPIVCPGMQFFRESAMPASAFATAHRLLRSLRNAIGYQHEAPWQYADYEIDPQSAFFPREPLATLPDPFDAWEAALEEAPSVLRLSTDADEEALALRLQGARWRQAIRTVRLRL
jgi:hypothetical protein